MFLWIWQIEKVIKKYGSIESLISKLKEINVLDVCIKYHEGSYPIGGGINYREDFLKYAPIFKKNGFKVGSWGYNYFNDLNKESNLIIEALNNSNYYIFDGEIDVRNKFSQTEEICKKIREVHPKAVIGYSSFPIVSYHTDIPYTVFDKYCDFASPQCYFDEMRWSILKCMSMMIEDHKKLKLNKPIYPSIEAYKLTLEQRKEFEKYGYSQFGLWDLDEIDSNCIIWLKSIRGLDKESGERTVQNQKKLILALQQFLNNANIKDNDSNKLVEDGIIGDKTRGALRKLNKMLSIQ